MSLKGDPNGTREATRRSFAPVTPNEPKARAAALELAEFMSEISERSLASGWDHNLEFDLWGILWDGRESAYYTLNQPERKRLARLSREAGGWMKWVDDNGWDNPVFVPESQWVREYAAHKEG